MSSMEVALNQTNNQDFEAGKKAALEIIVTVIRESEKGLNQIKDETKQEECKKRITGAELLYDQIKEKLLKTNKLD